MRINNYNLDFLSGHISPYQHNKRQFQIKTNNYYRDLFLKELNEGKSFPKDIKRETGLNLIYNDQNIQKALNYSPQKNPHQKTAPTTTKTQKKSTLESKIIEQRKKTDTFQNEILQKANKYNLLVNQETIHDNNQNTNNKKEKENQEEVDKNMLSGCINYMNKTHKTTDKICSYKLSPTRNVRIIKEGESRFQNSQTIFNYIRQLSNFEYRKDLLSYFNENRLNFFSNNQLNMERFFVTKNIDRIKNLNFERVGLFKSKIPKTQVKNLRLFANDIVVQEPRFQNAIKQQINETSIKLNENEEKLKHLLEENEDNIDNKLIQEYQSNIEQIKEEQRKLKIIEEMFFLQLNEEEVNYYQSEQFKLERKQVLLDSVLRNKKIHMNDKKVVFKNLLYQYDEKSDLNSPYFCKQMTKFLMCNKFKYDLDQQANRKYEKDQKVIKLHNFVNDNYNTFQLTQKFRTRKLKEKYKPFEFTKKLY